MKKRTWSPRVAWRRWLTASIFVLALLAVGFAQSSAGRRLTRRLKLAVQEQPFTELYFSNPQAVADATERFRIRQPWRVGVDFVIHSRERRRLSYHWSITSEGTLRSRGIVVLRAGDATTIRQTITTGCQRPAPPPQQISSPTPRTGAAGSAPRSQTAVGSSSGARPRLGPKRVHIVVSLMVPAQSISYWQACRA